MYVYGLYRLYGPGVVAVNLAPRDLALQAVDRGVTHAIRAALEWWFRDRRTGRIVIVQAPNLPILLWLGTVVARWLVVDDSEAHRLLEWAGIVILGWWAVDELVRGVNPWRRLLGLGGCIAVLAGIVGRVL